MIYDNVFRDQVFELGKPFSVLKYDYDDGCVYQYYDIMGAPPCKHDLSLLRVCRHLYRETALLPYQLAIFRFASEHNGFLNYPNKLEDFLVNRSWAQVLELQKIHCWAGGEPWRVKFEEETGTGLYWFAYLGLKQSDLAVHGKVL